MVALCDRGLASPNCGDRSWLRACPRPRPGAWHPCMRYPKNVTFCAEGGRRLPSRAFVFRPDTAWVGSGTAFGAAAAKRRCTLTAVWYAQQEEPWTILTGLPPDEVGVSWYALRFWIELGVRAVKSLGWQWQKTRVQGPPRALDCQHRQPRGLARFKLGSAGGPAGLAACPVDPLTQRLEGPGTGRSGAGWMPGRTHFRPGPSHSAAVGGSQGPAAAFFAARTTSRA